MKILVVDANPLISALIGGKAFDIFYSKKFKLITSEKTIWEVKKYISALAKKLNEKEDYLFSILEKLPVITLHPSKYRRKIKVAADIIGNRDIKDVDILALTLEINAPLWSQDKDFEGIKEITLLKTHDLL